MSALNNRVLVLNSMWQAINLVTARDAICKVASGKAKIVDSDFSAYEFENWVDIWSNGRSAEKSDGSSPTLFGTSADW